MKLYRYKDPFKTELGDVFGSLEIAYNTWGSLNNAGDNAIWICHALTANSDVEAWWPGMVGEGLTFDTSKYFIVCAKSWVHVMEQQDRYRRIRGPVKPWFNEFPVITVRDTVKIHENSQKSSGDKSLYTQ